MRNFLFALLIVLVGCAPAGRVADQLNPFSDGNTSSLGDRNNQALIDETGGGTQADQARHAMKVMGSYRQTQAPQPAHPVIQPAEVRLMWVPDHLNKAGDLVPAHYYYLRVLNDRWAVQDAFELEQQLNQGSRGAGSAKPWIYK